MDRPLTADELRALSLELVTHSERLEPFVPGKQLGTLETLALLGGLEKFTRQSIDEIRREDAQKKAQLARAQAAEAEAAAARASAQAALASRLATDPAAARSPGPPQTPAFGTRNRRYQPALHDPTVVQALLALRTRAAAQSAAAAAARSGASSSTHQPSSTPQKPRFQPERPAALDPSVGYGAVARRPGTSVPILRPRGPGEKGSKT